MNEIYWNKSTLFVFTYIHPTSLLNTSKLKAYSQKNGKEYKNIRLRWVVDLTPKEYMLKLIPHFNIAILLSIQSNSLNIVDFQLTTE